jgi:hypothetical protein
MDPRAFIFTSWRGEFYFNPASFIFPYVLLRGGLRGQNLQWLDARTYDKEARRLVDVEYGVDVLYINTDKMYEQPFTIFCRQSVLSALDLQNSWRKSMLKCGCAAFGNLVKYEERKETKWGEIECLFASDVDNGFPLSDAQYNRVCLYSSLSFQSWINSFLQKKEKLVGFIPYPDILGRAKRYFDWEEWVEGTWSIGAARVSTTRQGQQYTPVTLRAKVTAHGSRATFITKLLQHESPEIVCRTTGQTPRATAYYNKGELSLIERLAGAYNEKDTPKISFSRQLGLGDFSNIVEELWEAKDQGLLPGFIVDHGLTGLHGLGEESPGEKNGLQLIATDIPRTLIACSTHICLYGFKCPKDVIKKLGGAHRCSICSDAIFSVFFIYAVSAKRQQLAEELSTLQQKIRDIKEVRGFSQAEIVVLEEKLKIAAEDLMGWYLVERSLDIMIKRKIETSSSSNYMVLASDAEERSGFTPNIASDCTGKFIMRLQQACEFPEFVSEDFKGKINRAIRLILAGTGELSEALLKPSSPNPQLQLAAMIRQQLDLKALDFEKLLVLINMTDAEWQKHVECNRLSSGVRVGLMDEIFKAE